MDWSRTTVLLLVWSTMNSLSQQFITANPLEETPRTNEVSAGLQSVSEAATTLHECDGISNNVFLKRVFLNNRSVTCNDGSPAGYYIRRSNGSRRWIVYLEGGWYCFDRQSCHNRWTRLRGLMTSRLWPELRQVGGILSSAPQENPYWWNANHVFIPYCSSDSWSGAFYPKSPDHLAFLGSKIVLQVIKELLPQGLMQARKLYLAGSSAGGTGVLINLDRVAHALRRWGSGVAVRGIADSGWFLDNEPYSPLHCTDAHACAPTQAVQLGIKYWNGQVPDSCRMEHDPTDWWKCYFGYRIFPTMKTPLFVFQWLFDEAQMTADNVGTPVTKAQWDYIHRMGHLLRKTLNNVTAVFAPSCISHIVLTKRDWQSIKVNDVTLPQAIRCWEERQSRESRKRNNARRLLNRTFNNASSDLVSPRDVPVRHRGHKRRKNRGGSLTTTSTRLSANSSSTSLPRRGHRKKDRRRNRRKQKVVLDESNITSSPKFKDSTCNMRWLDECTWPQCNRACPKLRNPFTGEEMDFIELLKSFGLDMKSVATALGLDMETLQTMGNDHLLQILTQTTSK